MGSATVEAPRLEQCSVTATPSFGGMAANVSLVCVSAVLASLAFPPFELHWLAWVCLVPLLVALRVTSVIRASGWLMLLFGMIFLGLTLHWLTAIFGVGIVGIVILGSLPLILFGLGYRILSERAAPIAVTLMTPALWLAIDWLRCEGWYFRFSWAQLGFTQIASEVTQGLYPLLGVYGATFMIVLTNAGLAGLFDRRLNLQHRVIAAGAVMIAVMSVVSYGTRTDSAGQAASKWVTVLVAQDESSDPRVLSRISTQAVAGRSRPDLIVWPEGAVEGYPLSDPKLLTELGSFAKRYGSVLVVGCKEKASESVPCDFLRRRAMDGYLFYNSALLLGPRGDVLGMYHKRHPIQLFADGVPGNSYPVFSTPAGKLGVAICYDFDFASAALNLVRNGAEILVVPAFDPMEWGEIQHVQHTRMAEARALEVGRALARATTSGISQIICPSYTMPVPCGASAAAAGPVPLLTGKTPYVSYTHWLPQISILLCLLWFCDPAAERLSRVRR